MPLRMSICESYVDKKKRKKILSFLSKLNFFQDEANEVSFRLYE